MMVIQSDPSQPYIALPLPIIPGSVEFVKYQEMLWRIDQLLQLSGVEDEFIDHALALALAESKEGTLSAKDNVRKSRHAVRMLRCNIARSLSQQNFRDFSVHLADSELLQRFCRYDGPSCPTMTPSKSTLQRGATEYGADVIRRLVVRLIETASQQDGPICKEGGLVAAIDTDVVLLDSTCVKLDIHFPVDWVLLRDAIKSLIRAIECIRRHGLLHRMPAPKKLASRVNRLAMAMSNASRRGKGDRKERKRILRELKKMAQVVARHGERYQTILNERWQETDLPPGRVAQITKRIDNVLEKLPAAITQAHERIIGGRQVKNDDKLLSLYEPHAKVYSRGKAGADVEFGLQLLLGETSDGLICDWELVDGKPMNDTKHVSRHLKRVQEMPESIRPKVLVGDRGFDCQGNDRLLEEHEVENMICPKDPKILAERLGEASFANHLRRRAQTEARIGIMKHRFIGEKMPAKGYDKQNRHVAWAVLAHDLWVISRLPNHMNKEEEEDSDRCA